MVYLDNAATTRVCPEAAEAAVHMMTECFGNPSTTYKLGREAKAAVDKARGQIAKALGCRPDEVYFTSCGSEGDNWALISGARSMRRRGKHIISSAVEHDAVRKSLDFLEKEGYEITRLQPDGAGAIPLERVRAALRPDTILVSLMMVNNETGAINDIAAVARMLKAENSIALLHTDAVQGFLKVPFSAKTLGADMITISGHKIHAPKGIGALYIRSGLKLPPYIHGGGQERGLVSGTENTAGFIGLAAAMQDACEHLDEKMGYVKKLTDKLVKGIMENIPYSHYTGDPVNRLPGTASFVFEAIEGEGLILRLDNAGVCGSPCSACSTGPLEPSHVLMAIGLPHEIAHGSLRLTLGEQNTEEDVDYVIETVTDVVKTLRSMSPVWENGKPNLTAATELHAH